MRLRAVLDRLILAIYGVLLAIVTAGMGSSVGSRSAGVIGGIVFGAFGAVFLFWALTDLLRPAKYADAGVRRPDTAASTRASSARRGSQQRNTSGRAARRRRGSRHE